MALLELPHTRGCIVCGHDNPSGLHLKLNVDERSGVVSCTFTPGIEQIGFEGIIHGGVLSTVLDEAMAWAAIWAGKRFCVCGELNVRFRQPTAVATPLQVEAKIACVRTRLIETEATMHDPGGKLMVEAAGKYIPLAPDRNRAFVQTLVSEPQTSRTLRVLTDAVPS